MPKPSSAKLEDRLTTYGEIKGDNGTVLKMFENSSLKKNLQTFVKNEYRYISNLFDLLNIPHFNRKRNISEDDSEENLEILNVPEKKLFNKNVSKKSVAQPKSKSFPQTIDGLEKELEELKGTSMTYQKKLRKKGLQSRLTKKKRKEDLKKQKALMKQTKKGHILKGPTKLTKPVLNSDGDVVSNKFDFADNEVKKESKKKLGNISVINSNKGKFLSERQNMASLSTNSITGGVSVTQTLTKNQHKKLKNESEAVSNCDDNASVSLNNLQQIYSNTNIKTKIKKENGKESSVEVTPKLLTQQKPVFNLENKMVFSKVFVSENGKKNKQKNEKDPKQILQKLKENSQKISDLEKENKEKAVLLKEKQKWTAALKRASGEKIKDDPELLKKTIAKDRSKKIRSQKKWNARLDRVQKEKDDKQKKRADNIQARKNEKKKKKMKRAIKKGSFVHV